MVAPSCRLVVADLGGTLRTDQSRCCRRATKSSWQAARALVGASDPPITEGKRRERAGVALGFEGAELGGMGWAGDGPNGEGRDGPGHHGGTPDQSGGDSSVFWGPTVTFVGRLKCEKCPAQSIGRRDFDECDALCGWDPCRLPNRSSSLACFGSWWLQHSKQKSAPVQSCAL